MKQLNKKILSFLYLVSIIGFLFYPIISLAHVEYVVTKDEHKVYTGFDFSFFNKVFSESVNIFLILVATVVGVAFYLILKRIPFVTKYSEQISNRAESYFELIPWMMRLGLGIALIGAGTKNVFISPALSGFSQFSFFQILLGFLLLSGFLLTPAILMTLFLFLFALSKNFYIIGNFDFFALVIAFFILAKSKPGVDDLFGIPLWSPLKKFKKFVPLILRIGIGTAMMFLAIYEKFLNPYLSKFVVEKYNLTSIIPVSSEMWVFSVGLIEFIIGFLLFIGFETRVVSAITFLVLTLSFFYFQEEVYSHITLFTILSILFVTGNKLTENRNE